MTAPIRIPADVDRRDRVVGPFTARQLAILAATAMLGYLAWTATRQLIPPLVFVAAAVPIGTVVAVLVLTTRDGLTADRLLVAGIRYRLRPRHFIATPAIGAPPQWLTANAARRPKAPVARVLSDHDARLPESVTATGGGEVGVVDLGGDGLAVVAAAGTVNLSLRTAEEQEALVGQLGGWLHSLAQPVQILIRSTRLDLSGHITGLRHAAEDMSDQLADTAHAHADHLAHLAATEDLLRHQVLLVWREPLDLDTMPAAGLGGPSPATMLGWWFSRHRPHQAVTSAARRSAEARLLRRVTEARELLAPLGITVTTLDELQASAVVAGACNPGSLIAASADTVPPDAVITRSDDTGAEVFAPSDTDRVVEEVDSTRGGWFGLRGRGFGRAAGSRFAPGSLTIGARHLVVGSDYLATLAVTGYPRQVAPGWLSPLLTHPGRLDIAVHITPVDPATAAARLRRQLGRLESARLHDAGHGRLTDPQVDVAVEDAADLSARVARGEGRLYSVGIYLTMHATSEAELADEVAAVRALAASLLIDTCPLTYRAVPGWTATLPLGIDPVGLTRTFDTDALAAGFPFNSPQLPVDDPVSAATPTGVLYGRDAAGGLLFWDRFGAEQHNHNAVVLARSGAGKSYLVKAEILRSLYRGVEVIAIDPEDEYQPLAEAVDATYLPLGAPDVRINPFDLDIHTLTDGRRTAPADALARRKLFAHTLFRVLLGDQSPAQRAVLDTALTAAYAATGITEDPTTWARPAPTLSMVREQLVAGGSAVGDDLAAALSPYVAGGAFAGLIDGPTTTSPDGAMVVFSLRELPDELKTIGTLLALDLTWRQVSNPATRRPRLVTVDEAWWLMRQPAGAEFLLRAAKSFRKYWAGLTIATQDIHDVLSSDLGTAIVSNAPTQILLRQAPQAIDDIAAAFSLSDGERQYLLSAGQGQGLLATGTHRSVFATLASPLEHDLITSNPSEIANTTTENTSQHIEVYLGDNGDGFVELREENR
ncbi:PrgI family protein [Nocardia cyriacigeorgica]|uniref:PrgI family protein n=1 Tax=Nocardia cyriacigeorgica TaxID=135487 RepID=UPI0018946B01|nr:PrgI family protein [Nocardia cyriacigeorgica]MBF6102092.1 PrgI family protein [Nocardia cyriacigeorgica]